MLAFHIYPLPNGTEYDRNELSNETNVIQLFDACQILEAIITTDGWEFLIDQYGIEKLYELDCVSGWHDEETLAEYVNNMIAEPGFLDGYVAVLNYSLQELMHIEITTDFEIVPLDSEKMSSFNSEWERKIKEKRAGDFTLDFNYQMVEGNVVDIVCAIIGKLSDKDSQYVIEKYLNDLELVFGTCKACWKLSGKNRGSGNFFRTSYINLLDMIILEYTQFALVLMVGV